MEVQYTPIPREFYERHVVDVSRDLLGKLLVRIYNQKVLVGKIVETEAYRGKDDPASHAYRGKTPRNSIMFGKPGVAYIYTIYGMYHCLNVIAEPEGNAAGVLIRAIEPLKGIDLMKQLRGTDKTKNLTNGPGKLTKALAIDKSFNGMDLTQKNILFIAYPNRKEVFEIVETKRIGIKVGLDKMWRFYIRNNPFVSKK
ncbi:MAG: DNA-3-methyladenine glycosylase [Candidatus Odinarchaeota archaeon]|nr:DNA-3-methyladenine glycosylase [Candidatus Odinarchaeota archaeon]